MGRHFPDWLKAYCDWTLGSESPIQFHFWTGIATIAGALRGKVWRDEKTFRWSPNFYIVLVGPAGVAQKSTSMSLGMRLLEAVPGIHFGPSSVTWQRLGQVMQESAEEVTFSELDGTPGKFNISCVTLAVSELGTFLKLAQEGFAEVLIDMWEGQMKARPWEHGTVTSSNIVIPNPWLNMIGCTTPTWLQEHFPASMIGGGLTSRIIFVFGDKKRRLIAYPSQEYKGKDFELMREKLIADLTEIAALTGPFDITPAALAFGEAWYEQLWTIRPPHLVSSRFDAYVSRKQVFLHKLAMVRAAATGSHLILDQPHLEWADMILTDAERSMGRVFEAIGLVDQARHVDAMAHLLASYKRLTVDELFGFLSKGLSLKDFEEALKAAFKADVIRVEKIVVGGVERPYLILPRPLPGFDATAPAEGPQ